MTLLNLLSNEPLLAVFAVPVGCRQLFRHLPSLFVDSEVSTRHDPEVGRTPKELHCCGCSVRSHLIMTTTLIVRKKLRFMLALTSFLHLRSPATEMDECDAK